MDELSINNRWESVGGLLEEKPVICGGWTTPKKSPKYVLDDCFVIGDENHNITMLQKRAGFRSDYKFCFALYIDRIGHQSLKNKS